MEFREWMDFSLYNPQQGYYANRLEAIPDYVTAPNFGPYLGQALAREMSRMWNLLPPSAKPPAVTLIEAGCGSEAFLTRSILKTLIALEPRLFSSLQVILVDRSVARLAKAQQDLSAVYPDKIFACPDIAQIPPAWGFVVSNELLDALAVRLIRRSSVEGVEIAHVEFKAGGEPEYIWKECHDPICVSYGLDLPFNKTYALNLDAKAYLEILSSRLEHGFVMTADYGDIRPAVFNRLPVKAFSKGKLKTPDLKSPGSQDITSPVDFSLLIEWGEKLGFETLYYETLGGFLMRHGIGEMVGRPDTLGQAERNLQIKTLIHPYGFGEDFKVLIQGK
ncbi:MAG: SAM-dependent methyltransferase [Elusimicrobia bacterium]|nr:SAM-dependent methyltransferase [Elusimicrobiota bacterium]